MNKSEHKRLVELVDQIKDDLPHEWGYRDVTDGTFIYDDWPFDAAQFLIDLLEQKVEYAPEVPDASWIENPYKWFRAVPDEIREMEYPNVDIIGDSGVINYNVHPIGAFMGPGIVSHYRISKNGD